MQRYSLEIKLLSDSAFSSGKSFGNLIDSDVCFDHFGLPYIAGKRIKGLLRNSAEDLAEYLDDSDFHQQVNQCFGSPGKETAPNIFVGSAYIQDYQQTRDWLEYLNANANLKHKFNLDTESVLRQFTAMRSSTAIDEKGVALDKSLRTIRVLNKGLVFNAEIIIDCLYETILALAARNLHLGGNSRSRGLGQIDCRFIRIEGDENLYEQAFTKWLDKGVQSAQA